MRSVEVRSHKKDAAVSPVVGVMLMLVVTIVIAAVVAMFATGVFSETKAASTAVISLDNDKIVKNDDNVYLTTMQFSHKGGDKLNVNELTLLVTYNGATASNPFSTVANNTTTWSVGEKIGVGAQSSQAEPKNLAPDYLTSDPSYYTWSITDGSGLVIASGTRYFDVDKAETQTVFVSSDTLAKANVVIENNTAAAGETVYVYSNKKFVAGTATDGSSETEITVDSSGYWGSFDRAEGTYASITLVFDGTTTTVTLDGNGAESPWVNQEVTMTYGSNEISGEAYDVPTKTGFTFGGFAETMSGDNVVINNGGDLVANVDGWTNAEGKWIRTDATATLYAKWVTVTVVKNPDEVSISISDTCTLTCSVTGVGNPSYQWYKKLSTSADYSVISSATESTYIAEFDGETMTAGQTWDYIVKVSDGLGGLFESSKVSITWHPDYVSMTLSNSNNITWNPSNSPVIIPYGSTVTSISGYWGTVGTIVINGTTYTGTHPSGDDEQIDNIYYIIGDEWIGQYEGFEAGYEIKADGTLLIHMNQ